MHILPRPRIAPPKPALLQPQRFLGVDYSHTQTAAGGDLWLTRYGVPFARHLHPDNWLATDWFSAHRERLRGTSTIYRTVTQPIGGRSLELIVRYNRVGEDLPLDTVTIATHTNADFLSPFEEIATVTALRAARFGPDRRVIPTKRPLAVYSPPQRLELWQTGRSESRIAAKQARHPDCPLDIHRQYLIVYGWIKGLDALQAADQLNLTGDARLKFLNATMDEVVGELAQAGYRVLDMKPAHIIVRFTADRQLLRRPNGRLVYALIDYELLERITG